MPFKLILRRCEVVSNVWSENTALFERLMEIHSNSPKLYYGFNNLLLSNVEIVHVRCFLIFFFASGEISCQYTMCWNSLYFSSLFINILLQILHNIHSIVAECTILWEWFGDVTVFNYRLIIGYEFFSKRKFIFGQDFEPMCKFWTLAPWGHACNHTTLVFSSQPCVHVCIWIPTRMVLLIWALISQSLLTPKSGHFVSKLHSIKEFSLICINNELIPSKVCNIGCIWRVLSQNALSAIFDIFKVRAPSYNTK